MRFLGFKTDGRREQMLKNNFQVWVRAVCGSMAIFALSFLGCGPAEEDLEDVEHVNQAVTGCGPLCDKLCYIHFYKCSDDCDSGMLSCETACYNKQTSCVYACGNDSDCKKQCIANQETCLNKQCYKYKASCDMACVNTQIKCSKGCICKEECRTNADCGPGYVCAGQPGSRKCRIPPTI